MKMQIRSLMAAGLVAACALAVGLALPSRSTPAGADGAAPTSHAWDSADACSIVPDAVVASATGSTVTAHKLTGVVGGAGLAAHSTCFYTLANGGRVSLLARKSPVPDASKGAIEMARTAGGTMPPAMDVPGLGKAGLWTAETNTLQVFIDDTRYLTITGHSSKENMKTALVTIARTAMR